MDHHMDHHTCCCGPFRTRIETGTYVIALFGFAVEIIFAIGYIVRYHSISAGLYELVIALFYLSVIFAQKKNNPSLFLPYLIFTAIGIIISVLVTLGLLMIAIWAPQTIVDEWNKRNPGDHLTPELMRASLLFVVTVVGVSVALNAWFYSIIYRTYKVLKQSLALGFYPPPV